MNRELRTKSTVNIYIPPAYEEAYPLMLPRTGQPYRLPSFDNNVARKETCVRKSLGDTEVVHVLDTWM